MRNTAQAALPQQEKMKSQAWDKFRHNKRAMFGVIIVLIVALAVIFLPLVMDLDPFTTDAEAGFNTPPSAELILGTDDVGRDLFARLLYGGRISLLVGIACVHGRIYGFHPGRQIGIYKSGFYSPFVGKIILECYSGPNRLSVPACGWCPTIPISISASM